MKRLLQLIAIVLVEFGTPVRAAEDSGPFVFVQLADTQFGFFNNDVSWEQDISNFEFVVSEINRLKPPFVVICGDLVNKPGDAAQISDFKRVAAKINPAIKLYLVVGNHDVGTDPTPETLAAYIKGFGPNYYSFRYRDFAGIVLDSNLLTSPGKVQEAADAQDAWLKAELKKFKAENVQHIVIFQHHPYFLETPDEPDRGGFMNVPLVRRAPLLALLKEYGVKTVLAGHLHRNAAAKDGDLSVYATGPVGRPLGTDPSGMAIVSVQPTGITYRYVSLGQVPTSLAGRGGRGGGGAPPGRGAGAPPQNAAPAAGRQ